MNTQPRRTVRDQMAADEAAKPDAPEDDGSVGAALAKRDPLRAMLASMETEFVKALPTFISAEAFMRVCLTGLRSSKQAAALAKCERPTLFAALLDAARYGLMPFTDEGAIVPYGKTATFVPMYLGLVQMFYRTGQVTSVTAKMVAKNDIWDEAYGDGGGWVHKPVRFTGDGTPIPRGAGENPWILAYCYVTLRGGARTEVEVVTRADAEYVRDNHSKAYQNAERMGTRDSLWHTAFDAMWLKTAVRRQSKWAPKSAQMMTLLADDGERDRTKTTAQQVFTPGGPAAAWDGDVDYGTGNVTQGYVVGDDSDPWAAEPVTWDADVVIDPDGTVAYPAPSGPKPADTGPAGGGQDPAPAAAEAAAGAARTPAAQRDDDLGAVSRMLIKHGYEGDANASARLTLLCMLGRPDGHHRPLELASPGAASPLEAGTARAALTALIRNCNRTKRPIPDALSGLVDDFIALTSDAGARSTSAHATAVDPAAQGA